MYSRLNETPITKPQEVMLLFYFVAQLLLGTTTACLAPSVISEILAAFAVSYAFWLFFWTWRSRTQHAVHSFYVKSLWFICLLAAAWILSRY